MKIKNDLIGFKKGKLTVIEFAGLNKNHSSMWKCQCECGNITCVNRANLLFGKTISCGCIKNSKASQRMKKHGLSTHPIYREWKTMKRRCYEKKFVSYRWYGAKGITVCDEWKNNPSAFIEWALNNGWKEGLTLDRIDSSKNYEPSNCQWITLSENVKRRWNK